MSHAQDQVTIGMINYWEKRIAELQKYPTQFTDDGRQLDEQASARICDWRIRLAKGHLKKWKQIQEEEDYIEI
jgi:hypothetical protein